MSFRLEVPCVSEEEVARVVEWTLFQRNYRAYTERVRGRHPETDYLEVLGQKAFITIYGKYEILLQFSVIKRNLTLCEVGAHYLVNPIEEREDPQLEMISLKTGGVYGMVEAELRIIMTEILARLKG